MQQRFGGKHGGVARVADAEVVKHVVEVVEVDGGCAVEVAAGPRGGGGAEIVEDGVEVVEIDVAGEIGVAEEFRGDEDGIEIDRLPAEGGEGGGEGGVVDDGDSGLGRKLGTLDVSRSRFALQSAQRRGFAEGRGLDDEFSGGEIERRGTAKVKPALNAGEAVGRQLQAGAVVDVGDAGAPDAAGGNRAAAGNGEGAVVAVG